MDPVSHVANGKRKKYTKRSFLTIDKKFKRYHINRSCQSGLVQSIPNDSSTSDATSDSESLTTYHKSNVYGAESTPVENFNSNSAVPLKSEQENNYTQLHQKTKGIQVKPVVKVISVQASWQMKLQGVQTLPNKLIQSCGVQTEKNEKKSANSQNFCTVNC